MSNRPLAVWLDDHVLRDYPGLDDLLSRQGVTVLRSFERLPNPHTVAHFEHYRKVVVLGAQSREQLIGRIELAVATLKVPLVVALPASVRPEQIGNGPGVVDVIPFQTPNVARRIIDMSHVPVVSFGGARARSREPLASRPSAPRASTGAALSSSQRPCLAVASSTGGAWVLAELMRALPRPQMGPIVIAQHLEAEFVSFFADWLSESTGWQVVVVTAEVPLADGVAFVAGGGLDLVVDAHPRRARTQPPRSRYVPCADVLFASAAHALGEQALALVLSGMGEDGAAGLSEVLKHGGRGLVQAPGSALISSMPQAALKRAPGAVALPPPLFVQTLLDGLGQR